MAELLTIDQLVSQLRQLGVQDGDVLIVHSSLRAIGPVEGRAEGVLRALGTAVGQRGTLLMNIGARDDWGWVNDQPEAERARFLADAVPFESLETPSDPEVGVLPEVFRQSAGTIVSEHPEGRFAASGAMACDLVTDVPWDDYYGPNSPLERLIAAGGKVLRLGADLGTVTLIHYAEYLVPIATKRRVRRHRLVGGKTGPEIRTIECLDDSAGIVDYPGEDYFAQILRAYLASGRAAVGIVGHAHSELIDARDLVHFSVAWMSDHFTPSALPREPD